MLDEQIFPTFTLIHLLTIACSILLSVTTYSILHQCQIVIDGGRNLVGWVGVKTPLSKVANTRTSRTFEALRNEIPT